MGGIIRLEPELLQKVDDQDPEDFISQNLVNTLRNGNVEAGTFREQIKRFFGDMGVRDFPAPNIRSMISDSIGRMEYAWDECQWGSISHRVSCL